MDRRDERGIGETAVSEREEIELVVNEIELIRPPEYLCDMQAFPDLWIDRGVF